jgi:Mg-chelatase subunit ChlD
MRFIQQFGYTVRVGQDEAHQKWLIANDAALRAAAPPGTKYMGTFAVVFSTEKKAGGYIAMFELDSYGAMDTSAAAMKDAKGAFGKLLRDASQFIDVDLQAPWSNWLLKDVIDATVFDPKQ